MNKEQLYDSDVDRLIHLVTCPNHISATTCFTEYEAHVIATMASFFPVDDCLEAADIWEPTAAEYRDAQRLHKQGRIMAIFVARRLLAKRDPFGYLMWASKNCGSDIKPRLEAVK